MRLPWGGDANGAQNPLPVTMNGNKNITANFAVIPYTLSVTANNGTVAKSPDQATYIFGTQVVLTASPANGYLFTGWSGDASGTQNPLPVTIDSNKNITASFTAIPYTVSVNASNGTVTKTPDKSTYIFGEQVSLTATPSGGYQFTGWGGDASGTQNPLPITVNGNKNITANFTPIFYPLTISATNGTVSKSPDQASYQAGTVVLLTASPASGYQFTGWSGNASGTQNPLSVTMDGSKSITANFAAIGSVAFSSATFAVTEGTGTFSVQLLRAGGSSGNVSVKVTTTDGTALDGSDYTGGEQVVQFADGVTTGSASIPILNDTTFEVTENFTLAISTPTGGVSLGVISTTTATLTDDDQPGVLAFASNSSVIGEGAGTHTVTVNRTGGQRGAVSVSYSLGAVSFANPASTPGDFTVSTGTLNFADGETSKTIPLGIAQDTELEGNEALRLILSSPTGGASLGGDTTHTVTITDDDVLSPIAASYIGLLNGNFATSGYGRITLSRRAAGVLTGKVLANGKAFSFSGRLSQTGGFTKVFSNGRRLNLQIQNNGALSGSWDTGAGAIYAIAGERNGTGTKSQPVAQAGGYTAHLRGEDITPDGGAVRGYLRATVSATGKVTFIGALPDGKKLSSSSHVSVKGNLPVVFGLYQAKTGYLFGLAAITGTANARVFAGEELRWFKPPQTKGIYQNGVADAVIELAGHVWTKPLSGSRLVPDFDFFGGNMLVTLSAGDLASDIAKAVNLTTRNTVVVTPRTAERLTMSVKPSTGAFTGTFRQPNGVTRTFNGVFVQNHAGFSTIEGLFSGVSVPGLVTISEPAE